ncbi:hypothetical protein RJ639_038503, partial [Escallonia herrerae]
MAVLLLSVRMTVEAEIGLAARIKSSGGYFGLCLFFLVEWKMLNLMEALDVQLKRSEMEWSQHIIAIPEECRGKGWSKFANYSWVWMEDEQEISSKREIKEEKYAARVAILPLLQAEEDERFVVEWKKYLEEEARIMKDVPGWKVGESVYNSGRWMPPATGELRPDV